jgi:hypothetical protein
MADQKTTPNEVVKRLPASRIALQETKYNCWSAELPINHTVRDILNETYWAHFAKNLKKGDEIRAEAADGSFLVRLYVRATGTNWARVTLIGDVSKLSSDRLGADDENFDVEFPDEATKWCVRRKIDKSIVKQGFPTKDDAETWLAGHVGSLEGAAEAKAA